MGAGEGGWEVIISTQKWVLTPAVTEMLVFQTPREPNAGLVSGPFWRAQLIEKAWLVSVESRWFYSPFIYLLWFLSQPWFLRGLRCGSLYCFPQQEFLLSRAFSLSLSSLLAATSFTDWTQSCVFWLFGLALVSKHSSSHLRFMVKDSWWFTKMLSSVPQSLWKALCKYRAETKTPGKREEERHLSLRNNELKHC